MLAMRRPSEPRLADDGARLADRRTVRRHQLVYNDEYLATEIGQIGTQFDGPGHIGVITSDGMFFYNGRMLDKDPAINAYGLGPLGVEHVAEKGFVCRGVLLDAVAYRGGDLPIPTGKAGDPGIITVEDVEAMVAAQGIEPIGEGDCVFLHTGHGDIWHPDDWNKFDAAEKAERMASSMPASRALAYRPANIWPNAGSS